MIDGMTAALVWLPEPLLILLVAALAYMLRRSWQLTAFAALTLPLILNQGYWQETLSLVLSSALVSTMRGVPLGIAAAHRPWLFRTIRPPLDLVRTLPTFVYLIPPPCAIRAGRRAGADLDGDLLPARPGPPAPIGITSVPRPLIEAGESFSATPRQLLWKVELPSARPMVLAGVIRLGVSLPSMPQPC